MKRSHIVGTMLKAYRDICRISQVEFMKKSGISKSTATKLESYSIGEEHVINKVKLNTCEKIARGMNMLFSDFVLMMVYFEEIPNDELRAVVYFELAKWIMERQSNK